MIKEEIMTDSNTIHEDVVNEVLTRMPEDEILMDL